ncbi:MAG: oxygen-independent coproporphyrinogen III oxidase [Myxococcota bacterium]
MLSPTLVARYDRSGPRYTSYPPVPRWPTDVADDAWTSFLDGIDRPTALYVHVPFCWQQCAYCGCNMVVSRRQSAGDRYLDALAKQIDTLPPLDLAWIHLGGGTPTWLSPAQLDRLFHQLDRRGSRRPQTEVSIEVDPRSTHLAHIDTLARHRVTRLSIGVQSLDPTVLQGVSRATEAAKIERLVAHSRARGIASVNFDLMTGLPHQTPETLQRTIDTLLEWRPDRLSVFGYAHVPWMKSNQRAIDESALPNATERATLRLIAYDRLTKAGFRAIGFDHFARRGDALEMALGQGTLGRNFMGYTPYRGLPVVALGPSGISEFEGRFVQVESHLGRWYRALEQQGRVPVVRAYTSDPDDRLNAAIIEALLCQGAIDTGTIERRFGRLPDSWTASLQRLAPLEADGLVERGPEGVRATERGRFFLRVIAMAFDPALPRDEGVRRYSRTA